jgi:hypothetical protein
MPLAPPSFLALILKYATIFVMLMLSWYQRKCRTLQQTFDDLSDTFVIPNFDDEKAGEEKEEAEEEPMGHTKTKAND